MVRTFNSNIKVPFLSIWYPDLSIKPEPEDDIHQILVHGDGINVRRNNLIGSIEHWGPDFEIDVEVKVNSFSKSERILEIFRLASVEGNCCEIGQRLPALFSWSQDNTFHLTTNIGTEGNTWFDLPGFEEDRWYKFRIVQREIEVNTLLKDSKYFHRNLGRILFSTVHWWRSNRAGWRRKSPEQQSWNLWRS